MSEPVSVTFKLTQPEFYGIWRKLRSRQTRMAPVCGIAILVVAVLLSNSTLIVIGAALAVWSTVHVYVLLPRRFWQKMEQIREIQSLTFTEDAVMEELFQVKATFDWSYWTNLTVAGDAYALKSNRGYTFIPRRAFSTTDDEQRFQKLAARLTRDQNP